MTTTSPGYIWKLRQVMADRELWKTSELGPLLAERGVVLSTAQVYRLVAQAPQRLSLTTLAALCDIFSCTPNDLIEVTAAGGGDGSEQKVTTKKRPRRARVDPQ
jgi:DNA-binding Xre family transcriptional regulator